MKLSDTLAKELSGNILPFWLEHMSDGHGAFWGHMDGNGVLHKDAPRGAILYARIIWTFASAARILGDKTCKTAAEGAAKYFSKHFIDHEYGGVFWSVTDTGKPLDTKKQFYAIAFAIYGFAELYRASGNAKYLQIAIDLFQCIENHSLDQQYGGYMEACSRTWQPLSDMRLSDKDENEAKTMNTHLHILEAYTGLYRVWKDENLADSLRSLIRIFLDKIILQDGHMGLFFSEQWELRSDTISYGHEIEASWLLIEAAQVLGDRVLLNDVRKASSTMASASRQGYTPGLGLAYEFSPTSGHMDTDRHWWVQAENVVGSYCQYELSLEDGHSEKASEWLRTAIDTWEFIQKELVCPEGEWYWSTRIKDGICTPNKDDDRAGFWKCPYHNGRMCMEIIEKQQKNG